MAQPPPNPDWVDEDAAPSTTFVDETTGPPRVTAGPKLAVSHTPTGIANSGPTNPDPLYRTRRPLSPTEQSRLNEDTQALGSASNARMQGGMLGSMLLAPELPELGMLSTGSRLALRALGAARAITGAAVGGGAVSALQGQSPMQGAVEQGRLEATGQVVGWPIKSIAKRVAASSVVTGALSHLQQLLDAFDTSAAATRAARATAKTTAREGTLGVQAVQDAAQASTQPIEQELAGAKASARGVASNLDAQKAGLTREQFAAQQAQEALKTQFSTPPPMMPSHTQTGQAVQAVAQGPAKKSLNDLGEAVRTAAESGPPVTIGPVQEKLRQLSDQMTPDVMKQPSGPVFDNPSALARYQEALKAAGISQDQVPTLKGVLGDLQSIPTDQISFSDARKFTKLLDDGIKWDRTASTQLQGAAKAARISLRSAMSGYAPYDTATKAYEAAAPLFQKGYVAKLAKTAVDNPGAIVSMIKPTEPTRLQMLKDVLTTHASAGGGAQAGQDAWNAVRSNVVYDRLIKPGLDKFDGTITQWNRENPEFLDTLLGDKEGQQVLGNLKTISTAYQAALDREDASTMAASHLKLQAPAQLAAAQRPIEQVGRQLASTQEAGTQAVTQARRSASTANFQATQAADVAAEDLRQRGQTLRSTSKSFRESSLAKPISAEEGTARAATAIAFPHSYGALRSLARVIHGPKMADLVQWASYAPDRTQFLVRLLNSPQPGMAITNLLRGGMAVAGQESGPPPPMAVSHAGPPPGP